MDASGAEEVRLVEPEPELHAVEGRRAVEVGGELEDAEAEAALEVELAAVIKTRVLGRVLDVEGTPLLGVEVGDSEGRGEWRAVSHGGGEFLIEATEELPQRGLKIEVRDAAYGTLCASEVRPRNAQREHLVVAARALTFAGQVVDATGVGVAGARVRIPVGQTLLGRFPHALDMAIRMRIETETEEDGRFVLEQVPAPEGGVIEVSHADYEEASIPVPATARGDLRIEFPARAELEIQAAFVAGVVLLPDLSPASGALIVAGRLETHADEFGRFELPYPEVVPADTVLAASHAGHGAVALTEFGAEAEAARPAPPGPFRIVLSERTAISGVVVQANDKPCVGWQIDIWDGTSPAGGAQALTYIEDQNSGAEAQTGSNGSFRLTGLCDRSYVLQVYNPLTLVTIHTEPLPAGSEDVVIRIPEEAVHEHVTGRVVSRRGRALEGVSVEAKLVTRQTQQGTLMTSAERNATTDSEGRFTLREVSSEHAYLSLSGESIMPGSFELELGEPVDDLRIEVAQRCNMRVIVEADLPEKTFMKVVDSEDNALTTYIFSARGSSSSTVRILNGKDLGVLSTSEDAVALVLWGPIDRVIPVLLDPDRVVDILID